MFEFVGVQFHIYGFILGLAIVTGWQLVVIKAKQLQFAEEVVNQVFLAVVVGGFLGARLWHVGTDFYLYQRNLWQVFSVWNGGLSILGAVVGGVIALKLLTFYDKRIKLPLFLDLSVFGLPFAQAIGRVGNYVNQELYGYPSFLPWAIPISPEHRLPGLETFSTFHPLFAYEAVATLAAGLFIWWCYQRNQHGFWKIGKGVLFLTYLEYYAGIRVLLDFLRPDKALVVSNLGINQALLMVFILINGYWLWKQHETRIAPAQK